MENILALQSSDAAESGLRKAISAIRHARDRRRDESRAEACAIASREIAIEEQRRARFDREAVPHMDALYNFALRMTGAEADARDLVQETYLKAYRFFDRFESGTNCKAWLFRIMKNSYINRYRRAQKTPDAIAYDAVADLHSVRMAADADANDLRAIVFDRLLGDEVTTAIEALPEDFRTVVMLCDIEGFTYEEISEVVGCPVGTVRSRLHRGRKLLRESLLSYARLRGYVAVPEAGTTDDLVSVSLS